MNKNSSSFVAADWLLLLAAIATPPADARTVPALINHQGQVVSFNGLTEAQWEFFQPMLDQPKKRERSPTEQRVVGNAILDCQNVKADGHGGEVGYDAGNKIKGRKRHILVDGLGLVLGAIVPPASCPEREGAKPLLDQVADWFPRLRKIWINGGYTGEAFVALPSRYDFTPFTHRI